jgi:nicotinate-nucleotide adenylyltransferase
MNIALFGTSADPPTIGHKTIIEWLGQHFDLCVVWVSNNPFKSHAANMEQRIEMMRRMVATINSDRTNPHNRQNIQLRPEISSPAVYLRCRQPRKSGPMPHFIWW